MQTLIVLIEFTPLVNFLRNDNSRCCITKATKTESAHHECRIYGSRPAGRYSANVESTDPGRNVLRVFANTQISFTVIFIVEIPLTAVGFPFGSLLILHTWYRDKMKLLQCDDGKAKT